MKNSCSVLVVVGGVDFVKLKPKETKPRGLDVSRYLVSSEKNII